MKKEKHLVFINAEEKTKLLDFAKRKNEDFTLKDLKIEIVDRKVLKNLKILCV